MAKSEEYYFHRRQHSDALLHEVPLQISAARLSLWTTAGGKPAPFERDPEFELLDTASLTKTATFDVVVEYAKARRKTFLIRITAHNRAPKLPGVHVIPTIWFRNTWSWNQGQRQADRKKVDVPGKISTSRSSIRKPASSGSIARMPRDPLHRK